jgi:hypothetical protein
MANSPQDDTPGDRRIATNIHGDIQRVESSGKVDVRFEAGADDVSPALGCAQKCRQIVAGFSE